MLKHIRPATLLLLLILPLACTADPGSTDTEKPLSVHGWCQGSKELAAKCYSLWKSQLALIEKMEEATAKKDPKGAPGKECGALHAASKTLERQANHLIEMGEPAGVDFLLRSSRMGFAAWNFAKIVRPSPEGQKIYTSSKLKMDRAAKARAKQIESMEKRLASGQFVPVEKELYETFDDFWEAVIMFSVKEKSAVFDPYRSRIESKCAKPVMDARKKKNLEQLAAALQKHQPNMPAIAAELDAAVKALAAGPTASVGGKPFPGPTAFEGFFRKWQIMHLGLLRCEGIDGAMKMIGRAGSDYPSSDDAGSGGQTPWGKATAQLNELMLKNLPALIAADAARANEQEAQKLYLGYISKIAPLTRRTGDDRLAQACEQPLDALAIKGGQMATFVSSYRKATDDMLLWRGRAAKSMVKKQQAAYPDITVIFNKVNQSDNAAKYLGLLPDPSSNGSSVPTLRAGSEQVLPIPIQRIAKTPKASLTGLTGAASTKLAFAGFRGHTFGIVPLVDVSTHVAELKKDLLLSEGQPPLTLASAISANTAEGSHFANAGGDIQGFVMEAMITRFANLPMTAEILVPVTKLVGKAKRDEMLMRFNVKPNWVAHDHFFATVE